MTAASENDVPNTIKTETESTMKTESEAKPTEMKSEEKPIVKEENETESKPTAHLKTETESKPAADVKSEPLEPISTENVEVESREYLLFVPCQFLSPYYYLKISNATFIRFSYCCQFSCLFAGDMIFFSN
jgi:hypothetical protein